MTRSVNDLMAHETPGMYWTCRDSTTGRGIRLHQTGDYYKAPEQFPWPVYNTPQEALDAYLESKETNNDSTAN